MKNKCTYCLASFAGAVASHVTVETALSMRHRTSERPGEGSQAASPRGSGTPGREATERQARRPKEEAQRVQWQNCGMPSPYSSVFIRLIRASCGGTIPPQKARGL